jgi:hypothetical protein
VLTDSDPFPDLLRFFLTKNLNCLRFKNASNFFKIFRNIAPFLYTVATISSYTNFFILLFGKGKDQFLSLRFQASRYGIGIPVFRVYVKKIDLFIVLSKHG